MVTHYPASMVQKFDQLIDLGWQPGFLWASANIDSFHVFKLEVK